MSREVILYIASSIDGYIAEENGNIDFLEEDLVITEEENSYQELLEQIDTVVMGRTTYDQVVNELMPGNYPYEDKLSYIITSHPDENTERRIFTNESPVELVKKLKEETGKAIWIIGGGSIIAPLVEENLIDTYVLTTIPVILGKGIPLFKTFKGPTKVEAKETYQKNGMIFSTFKKKED